LRIRGGKLRRDKRLSPADHAGEGEPAAMPMRFVEHDLNGKQARLNLHRSNICRRASADSGNAVLNGRAALTLMFA